GQVRREGHVAQERMAAYGRARSFSSVRRNPRIPPRKVIPVIKKDISYEDLDGNTVIETFHFNLSTAELADMALTSEGGGGLADEIRKIQATSDVNLVLKSFKKILEAS